jgi:hypothetical protein
MSIASTRGCFFSKVLACLLSKVMAAQLPFDFHEPQALERILVLKKEFFELMARGEKTLEVRHQPLQPGHDKCYDLRRAIH